MVRVAQDILTGLGEYGIRRNSTTIDKATIRSKLLEFIKHLSNVAGFCDGPSRKAIVKMTDMLSFGAIDPLVLAHQRGILALAIGIQVDFAKKPFRVVGLDVKALGAQLKAVAER